MNRADREGVRRERVGAASCFETYAAVRHYGFDVLHRGAWTVPGAHAPIMEHLRERAPLPGGAR